ncbi:hypothetical protein Taro_029435 [Colocasia esculenta]|uniref:Uncharacterized protein n=1 Tax=Colocasia esculenta TaxID=4460 RepID=A0A843VR50_COLES|nr:hypothetical protein [Colocasia esculenta]
MNLEHLRNFLLESPLRCFVDQRRNRNNVFAFRWASPGAFSERSHLSQNWRRQRLFTSPQFSWRNADFVWRNSCLHSRSKIKCTQEPFSRSKDLIRPFLPLWEEGLLLIRCSVFVAVLSAAGLLVWYCQFKSRSFVEAHLLPSVCSILSEYLQREINFGKVRSISPLGITLQSCSIGPHQEEFSCGELPIVKLRVRPFASMRRGKIVIDAVLSQPNILVAQKEDFSWLGIPTPSDSSLKRHSSSEEGIDFRTKTRRVAREKAAADWAKERARLAREFARLGYIIPLKYSKLVSGDAVKDVISNSYKLASARPFFCMNEHLHRRDHHSVDMGIEYGLKHAELEKSFGIKTSSNSWFRFWPRMDSDPLRHRFKRKNHKKMNTETHISSKLRILRHSAAAALAYFNCLDGGKTNEPFALPVEGSSYPEYSERGDHPYVVKDDGINKTKDTGLHTVNGNGEFQKQSDLLYDKGDKHLVKVPFGTVPSHFGKEENSKSLNRESSFEGVGGLGGQHDAPCYVRSGSVDALSSICQPHLMVLKIINRLFMPSQNSPFIHRPVEIGKPVTGKLSTSSEQGGELKQDHGGRSNDKLALSNTNLKDSSLEAFEDLFKGNKNLSPQRSISNIKSALFFFSRTIEELLSDYLASQIQRLRSTINMKGAAELAEGVDVIHAEGILKMLPVTLDSVYFSGGSLMLLGYGDQEPRCVTVVH